MNTRANILSLAAVACLSLSFFGCNATVGDATDGDTSNGDPTDNGSNPTDGGGGGFSPCDAGNPCPDGQFCFNGICAIGCNSDGDCASNQYCDTDGDRLCHNKTVETCPETPCAEGQECVNGFCSAGATETCMAMPNGEDGCAKNELCIAEPDKEESYKCYAFPACAADDTCPVGSNGAVCNTGLLPNKDRICLVGACADAAEHCPPDDKCVKFTGEQIGSCSSGAFGDLCNVAADCVSNMCNVFIPGQPGICM